MMSSLPPPTKLCTGQWLEIENAGLSGPLSCKALSAWLMTLAGHCDNQAIGGFRHIE
jgi:hypothetical protein